MYCMYCFEFNFQTMKTANIFVKLFHYLLKTLKIFILYKYS